VDRGIAASLRSSQSQSQMADQYCVYILTNQRHTVLYTGVTSDLKRRVHQHREKLLPGFTHRYNVSKLVYYECTEDVSAAIAREKQIKAGSRRKKIELINRCNPKWQDLYNVI
jgi:putative endonuclease